MKKFFIVAAFIVAGFGNQAWAEEVQTVAQVDLSRYVGTWYEIARFPNSFQENCAGNVTAQYNRREDGEIDVINRCHDIDGKIDEAQGRARVADAGSNAKLKVRFAPDWLGWLSFLWADYWIVDLAQDYSTAAVGDPSRDYLWILSRTPGMETADYEAMVNRLTALGFDTAKLVKTRQAQAEK